MLMLHSGYVGVKLMMGKILMFSERIVEHTINAVLQEFYSNIEIEERDGHLSAESDACSVQNYMY